MVFIHFPSQYTEEEEMLQKKYQKLKKKKKALQQLKAPKLEPSPIQNPLKFTSEAKQDAKEVAKKLLKSGAISAIKVENKERQGFKRPKTLERRRSGPEKPGAQLTGYHPFTAAHIAEEGPEPSAIVDQPPPASRPAVKKLYDSFISSRKLTEHDPDRAETSTSNPNKEKSENKPRPGNTVYIHGVGITESILKSAFEPFGKIINITMEMDKNCGFVTFESTESAGKAISSMDGTTVANIPLKEVSLARRQPMIAFQPGPEGVPNMSLSSSSWSTLATYKNVKGNLKDPRSKVVYEEDLFQD